MIGESEQPLSLLRQFDRNFVGKLPKFHSITGKWFNFLFQGEQLRGEVRDVIETAAMAESVTETGTTTLREYLLQVG